MSGIRKNWLGFLGLKDFSRRVITWLNFWHIAGTQKQCPRMGSGEGYCLPGILSGLWALNTEPVIPLTVSTQPSLHRGVSVHCVKGQQGGKAAACRLEGAALAWRWRELRAKSGATWKWLTKGLWLKQVLGDNHRLKRSEAFLCQQHA